MIKRLPILVMIYMVAALSWWSVLLLQQNEQLFHLKMEFLTQADVVADLKSSHERQKKMIMGEGLVFALSMVLGTTLSTNLTSENSTYPGDRAIFYCRFLTN
ncbi:MAG: hypothetical protein IPP37_02020 [Saprospiraceae bacterium]|nr:hypothetical protein [Saprospiraceae bacterium]